MTLAAVWKDLVVSTPEADPGPGDATATVTVRGEAVLRAEPDEAMLWVTLTALDADPGRALADVSRRSEALGAMLDELGVEKKDRSTTGVTVYEEFDHTPSGRRSLGHRAAATVSARFTDPEPIGRLMTKAAAELQARIDGPRWQIAVRNPIRLEAAREAAADGRRRAQAFADGVGAKLGHLVKLTEPNTESAGPMRRRTGLHAVELAGGEPMPIEAGEHEVSAVVDVTFTLESG